MSIRRGVLLAIAAGLLLVAADVRTSAQAGRAAGSGAMVEGQGGRGGRGGAPAAPAGPIPRRSDGKPDLTGRWNGSGGELTNTVILEEHPGGFGIRAGKSLIIDPPNGTIPYQPWALAERDRRREDANGYEDVVGHCEFYDIGRVVSFPMEIMHVGNNIVIHAQQQMMRTIYMGRREHLPSSLRLWIGDSIGRWDGETLVIDTTNFNGKTRLALGGDFYSRDAHLLERFRMVDANTINWTLTITDPNVFTRPWTMTSAAPMTRQKVVYDYDDEDTCHEGNVDLKHLMNLYQQTYGDVPPPVGPHLGNPKPPAPK